MCPHGGTRALKDVRLARLTWPWSWLAGSLDEVSFADLQHQARGVDGDAAAGEGSEPHA